MIRRHQSQSSGQTLPLFAIMVPGMIALMALGLDGAQIFLERREAQSAADLAALAGVRSLPDSAVDARTDAKTVGTAHGFEQSEVVALTPYDGSDSKIEVTVNSEVETFFMSILGLFGPGDFSSVDVSARAVAIQSTTPGDPGGEGFAMFSLETSCGANDKAIDISGSDNIITGSVHAESNIDVGGSSNTFDGPTTYNCSINDGGGNSYNPPHEQLDKDAPLSYAWADYRFGSGQCDFVGPSGDVWDLNDNSGWTVPSPGVVGSSTSLYQADGKTLKDGVYCTRSTSGNDDKAQIAISRQGTKGNVSFMVGYGIDMSASDVEFTPYLDPILVFSNGNDDKAIQWQGSDGQVTGLFYAPNGTADTSGSDNSDITGGIIARYIKWSGSGITLNGNLGAGGGGAPVQTIALIE